MKCIICKAGETTGGKTNDTLQLDQSTNIIKEVTVMTENAIKQNAEVNILRFVS